MKKIIVNERYRDYICSFACGVLLGRGLPMAAFSSGWELSAAVGVRTGEALAIVIFLLGCSAVSVAQELKNARLSSVMRTLSAVLYSYVVCGRRMPQSLVSAAICAFDCLIVCAAVMLPLGVRRAAVISAIIAAFGVIIALISNNELPYALMLTPLAASLTAGFALAYTVDGTEKKWQMIMLGAAAVMAADIIRV